MLSHGIIYCPKNPCSTPEILRDFYYVMQGYIWNNMTEVSLLLQFVVGSAPIWHKYPGLQALVLILWKLNIVFRIVLCEF